MCSAEHPKSSKCDAGGEIAAADSPGLVMMNMDFEPSKRPGKTVIGLLSFYQMPATEASPFLPERGSMAMGCVGTKKWAKA